MTLAAALFAAATQCDAQTDWRADAAITRVRPAGSLWTSAGSLSVLAQQQVGSFAPILSGAATITSDSVAAAQLLMGARVLPPWSERAPIDVGAMFALYGIAKGDRGQSRSLYARQQVLADRSGMWIGGALGQIDRELTFSSNAIDAGAWLTRGRTRFTVMTTLATTEDQQIFAGTVFTPNPFAPNVRVADASLMFEYAGRAVDIEASFGGRFAVANARGSRGFGSASVALHVSRLGRLVFSAGSQLADPLRGTPEWKYASVGLRFANVRPVAGVPPGRTGPVIDATRTADGRIRIVVAASASVQSVELIGTLTQWEPVALERAINGWELTLDAPPGLHRVQIRVNGGDWRVPANLMASRDEFGRRAGVIVIP